MINICHLLLIQIKIKFINLLGNKYNFFNLLEIKINNNNNNVILLETQ